MIQRTLNNRIRPRTNALRAATLAMCLILMAALPTASLGQQPGDEPTPPTTQPEQVGQTSETQSSDAPPPAGISHLVIDRENGWIDIEATVVLRDADWLELLACLPGTRTHESILAVHARPSHIHLALLMLGLEPGAPLRWVPKDETFEMIPPSGAAVSVSLIVTQDDQTTETPANHWLIDRRTKQPPPDNVWLFTGSTDDPQLGEQSYGADLGGSVISLVSFGDDVLARPNNTTNENDEGAWGPNTKLIPPIGTPVLIRIRPIEQP